MARILITGATGFVGGNVAAHLVGGGAEVVCAVRRDPGADFPWPWRVTDLSTTEAIQNVMRESEATSVVHLAIGAGFEEIAADRRRAFDGYIGMTRRVVDAANKAGAQVAYVSTDWVFDGTGHAVDEDEPVNPVNLYGMFKALSERVVLDRADRGFVARVGGVQAANIAKPNMTIEQSVGFGNLALAIAASLQRGERVTVWEGGGVNGIASPITASEIGERLRLALDREIDGVLHLVGPDPVSRMEVARIVCAAFDLDPDLLRSGRVPDTARLHERVPYDTSLSSPRTDELLGGKSRPLLDQLVRLREAC